MGQAKQRGTFAQRREQAVIHHEHMRLEKLAADMEIENGLTPEEKQERKMKRQRAAQFLAMAAGISHGI